MQVRRHLQLEANGRIGASRHSRRKWPCSIARTMYLTLRSKASRWVRSLGDLAAEFRGQLIFQLKFVEVCQGSETERENERAQDHPRSEGAGKADNARYLHALVHRKR